MEVAGRACIVAERNSDRLVEENLLPASTNVLKTPFFGSLVEEEGRGGDVPLKLE